MVSLDKNGLSYNNLRNARLCVPDKTKIILKVFNMMQVINELRLLFKTNINVNVNVEIQWNYMSQEKVIYMCNPGICAC